MSKEPSRLTRSRRISERNRFIGRARYLKDDRSFREACEESASSWNKAFPEFPVRLYRDSPPDAIIYRPDEFLYPNALEEIRSLSRMNHRLTMDRQSRGIHPKGDGEVARTSDLGKRMIAAKQVWSEKNESLWTRFFHPSDFPHWMNCTLHPAHPFVAGSIIWRPEFVSEEWVLDWTFPVIKVPINLINPHSLDHLPELAALRAENRMLETILDRCVITECDRQNSMNLVREAGATAYDHAVANVRYCSMVPVNSGMVGREIADHASKIADDANADDLLKTRAKTLFEADVSLSDIGRRLGVDRKTASHWVTSNEDDSWQQQNTDSSGNCMHANSQGVAS